MKFSGHKRLKKSFETFKKSYETEYTKVNRDLESYMERVMSKLASIESRNQDLGKVFKIKKFRFFVKTEIFFSATKNRDLKQNKDFVEMELKVTNIKELLENHNETFDEILESLNLNQMSISDLKQCLNDGTSVRSI